MCGSFIEAGESVGEVMQIKQLHDERQIVGNTQTHPHIPTHSLRANVLQGLPATRTGMHTLPGISVRAEQEDSLAH